MGFLSKALGKAFVEGGKRITSAVGSVVKKATSSIKSGPARSNPKPSVKPRTSTSRPGATTSTRAPKSTAPSAPAAKKTPPRKKAESTSPTRTPKEEPRVSAPRRDPNEWYNPSTGQTVKLPPSSTSPAPIPPRMAEDFLEDDAILGRAAQEAAERAAAISGRSQVLGGTGAGRTLPPVSAPATAAREAGEEALETAVEKAAKKPLGLKGALILTAATQTPSVVLSKLPEERKAESWYAPAQTTADILSLLGGAGFARSGYRALKGPRGWRKAGGAVEIAGAGIAADDPARRLLDQALGGSIAPELPAPAVREDRLQQIVPPGDIIPGLPEEGVPGMEEGPTPEDIVEEAIENITSGNGTVEDADVIAKDQEKKLNDSVSQALAELEEAYGGGEGVTAAAAAGDPILLQQLAAIDADYQMGLAQIQANYAGALSMVAGYQQQANALMQDATAKMAASFEAASGGLEGMSPSAGMTGAEAAAAGVSDTALGGAGVTGAALLRGLSGAAQAQGIADQFALGTSLSDQLATGRLTQADLEAALSRQALGAKAEARTASAQRQAEERIRKEEQAREDRIRLAEIKYQRALDKEAQKIRKREIADERKFQRETLQIQARLEEAARIAAMTPAERAAYTGKAGSTPFKVPSWIGKRDTRNPNKVVKVPGASGTVTVEDLNNAREVLDSYIGSPDAQDPTKSFAFWASVYSEIRSNFPDYIKIYKKLGLPANATEMVTTLFPKGK